MQDVRQQLERQRDDIVARLRDFQAGAPDTGTGLEGDDAVRDLGDHVEQHTRREMGFMTRQRLVARLQRVQAALERLKRGVYGVCAECGASIAPKRLRAIPEAETCVPCQERMERRSRAAA
jgi:DnaK suppressor protein